MNRTFLALVAALPSLALAQGSQALKLMSAGFDARTSNWNDREADAAIRYLEQELNRKGVKVRPLAELKDIVGFSLAQLRGCSQPEACRQQARALGDDYFLVAKVTGTQELFSVRLELVHVEDKATGPIVDEFEAGIGFLGGRLEAAARALAPQAYERLGRKAPDHVVSPVAFALAGTGAAGLGVGTFLLFYAQNQIPILSNRIERGEAGPANTVAAFQLRDRIEAQRLGGIIAGSVGAALLIAGFGLELVPILKDAGMLPAGPMGSAGVTITGKTP